VWWVSFDPSVGGEARKSRPAIVVSNNAANAVLNRIVVVPLTSQTDKIYPSEARSNSKGERPRRWLTRLQRRPRNGCAVEPERLWPVTLRQWKERFSYTWASAVLG
jgi:hypothetical protein